jgi:hypothetical protein
MKKAVVLMVAALLGAATASSGCLSEDDACPPVAGDFLAVYIQLDGSCSMLQPTRFEFENKTMDTDELSDPGGIIRTKVNRMGCTLAVTKTRTDDANITRWQMIGDLDIANSKKISGIMTRYEWTPEGEIACQGLYETTMNKIEPLVKDDTI